MSRFRLGRSAWVLALSATALTVLLHGCQTESAASANETAPTEKEATDPLETCRDALLGTWGAEGFRATVGESTVIITWNGATKVAPYVLKSCESDVAIISAEEYTLRITMVSAAVIDIKVAGYDSLRLRRK